MEQVCKIGEALDSRRNWTHKEAVLLRSGTALQMLCEHVEL